MRSLAFIALSTCCASAFAQDRVGGYLGGEAGKFDYSEDLTFFAPPGAEFHEGGTSLKLFGGYRFSEYFGVEADWRTIDELEMTSSFFAANIGTITEVLGVDIDALTVRALGYLPLSWGSLFLGAGIFDYDADVYLRTFIPGAPPSEFGGSASDSGGSAIMGVQWELDQIDIRFNYEWFNFEDADADQTSVGIAYRFR